MNGELAVVERLRQLLPGPPEGQTWIGDDAAVVAPPTGDLLLAADTVVAGVHVDLDLVGLDDLGWKSISVNVSDIAAMGGTPMYALVALCGPPDTDVELVYQGVQAAAEAYACPVVGGDLSGACQLVVSVSVAGDAGPSSPVLRSGAAPGDAVLVTGPLGASAAGLRLLRAGAAGAGHPLVEAHRRPRARPDEGRAARAGGATAMIDVSDGLASDVRRLAQASGVGLELEAATVPLAAGAGLDEALGGGEDYELVFTANDPGAVAAAFARAGLRPPVAIGRCTPDRGRLLLDGAPLPAVGWEHEWR